MILRIKEKFWPMLLSFLTFYLMFAQKLKLRGLFLAQKIMLSTYTLSSK